MALQLYLYKSTDGGQTWEIQDPAGAPTDITETTNVYLDYMAVGSYEGGSVIPIVYVRDSDGSIVYLEFDTGTDTYGTLIDGGPDTDIQDVAVQRRLSDGAAIVMFIRDDGVGEPVFYAPVVSGVWGSEVQVSDGAPASTAFNIVCCLQDESAAVHFIYAYTSGPDRIGQQRSLSSSDVLSNETQFNVSPGVIFTGIISGDSILLATTRTFGFPAVNVPCVMEGTPLSEPVWTLGISSSDNGASQAAMVSDGSDVFLFYVTRPNFPVNDREYLKYVQFNSIISFGPKVILWDSYNPLPNEPPVAPQFLENICPRWTGTMWQVIAGLRYPIASAPGQVKTGFYMDEATTTSTSSSTTTTTATFTFTTGSTTSGTTSTTTTATTTTVTFTTGTPEPPPIPYRQFQKDPDAVLDYSVDWDKVLEADEVIDTSSWAASDVAISFSRETIVGKRAIAYIGGGEIFNVYVITNTVTTSLGRVYNQQFRLSITRR